MADGLHALVGEVAGEAGQHQARAIDRRLTDNPLEAAGAGDEVELEGGGVFSVETLYGCGVVLHGCPITG